MATLTPPVTFQLDRTGTPLGLPAHASDEALWTALCHRVVRRPADLREHVRRVSLCHRPSLTRCAGGALADLLHVLDGRGHALATRLHARVSGLLPAQERLALGRWACAGHLPDDAAEQALLSALPGRLLPAFAPPRLAPDDAP